MSPSSSFGPPGRTRIDRSGSAVDEPDWVPPPRPESKHSVFPSSPVWNKALGLRRQMASATLRTVATDNGEFVQVRIYASGPRPWTTSDLSDYLAAMSVLVAAAEAVEAENTSAAAQHPMPEWRALETPEWTKLERTASWYHGHRMSWGGPAEIPSARVVSIGIGSIDLVVLLSQIGGAAGVLAVLRSVIVQGPEWIVSWADLPSRLRVQRARRAVELRELADKLESQEGVTAQDRSLLRAVQKDEDIDRDSNTVRMIELAGGVVRGLTPDIDVLEVDDDESPR